MFCRSRWMNGSVPGAGPAARAPAAGTSRNATASAAATRAVLPRLLALALPATRRGRISYPGGPGRSPLERGPAAVALAQRLLRPHPAAEAEQALREQQVHDDRDVHDQRDDLERRQPY